MDTAKVEVILRAVELGSLSKAAEEYLYTPSAVSHMVNSLEDEIGTKIIRRTHMGIEPEEGSEHIFSYLRKLVETKNKIRELAAGANTLTIGTYASLFKSVFPGIIKSFKKKHPEVDINIIVHDDLKVLYEKSHPDIIFGENLENADMEW